MEREKLTRIGRKLLIVLALALVVFVVSLAFPPLPREGMPEKIMVLIPRGAQLQEIAGILKESGVIRSKAVFILAARAIGAEKEMKAGRFKIDREFGVFEVIGQLTQGMKPEDLVTIPEGLTSKEIADILYREIRLDPKTFLALVDDSTFAHSVGVNARSLEGYLFPDTYGFVPGMEPAEIVREMVSKGRHAFGVEFGKKAAEVGLSWHQVLTLASIVEGEAQVDDERPRIAAVFTNRLKQGWRLQADPTVAYALGGRRDRIVYRDLEVRSPYNTYFVTGLPPGPICNPGKSAVSAVIFPLKDCEDMYFVARGDGTHIFSKTIEEHLAAIRSVRDATRSRDSSGA
ncbi:MAG: endolytic transglycosylase MltG [Candidatus Eisenbacteria bacterium]|nr:endolytic transglycosylase MltG [Candidatus Eisenbacteria bacterium]